MYTQVTGDADSSFMTTLERELPAFIFEHVRKELCTGHMKGNLWDKLDKLKKSKFWKNRGTLSDAHKAAFCYYFSAAIKANAGNPEAMKIALEAMILHLFNDHSKCVTFGPG